MSTQGTLYKKALQLSYFTLAYGVVECVLSIIFGVFAGSIALLGFGLDSLVESLSAGIMVWRFGKHGGMSEDEEEIIEKRAEKLIRIYVFDTCCLYFIRVDYQTCQK